MKAYLLAGAGLCAIVCASSAAAQSPADAAGSDAATAVDEIVVTGYGATRQVQNVDGAELLRATPGASPLKLVEKLPNVNLQAADPFGSYEWSARISIRSFNQNQLGFTLDDVPLGDMTYGNHNGLHISRAIISENVGGVELAQGAGSLETASSSNLGGSLKYRSHNPQADFGGLAAVTAGEDNTYRGFLRLESGELEGGFRGYVSYAYNTADKWKGVGEQKQQQFNIKAIQPIGEGSITGWLNWSKRRENDYQDLSLEMISRLGYAWDNISDDWPLAVRVADIGNNRGETGVTPRFTSLGTVYPAPIATIDDAYFDASGLRDDLLGAVTVGLPIGDTFDLRATAYGHNNEGQGLWYTPYVPSPNYGVAGATANDAPISIRTTEYDIRRYGLIASGTVHFDGHAVNAGVWLEDNDFTQARRYYALNRSAPQRNSLKMQRESFRTDWEYDFKTTTRQFHIQDTWTVTDALAVNFGFKSLSVENEAVTVSGANKTGKIKASKGFLPQAGLRYDVSTGTQLFAGYSRNMRTFPSSNTSGPFSASLAGFLAIKDKLKPELSDTVEAGIRYRSGGFQGVLAAYHVEFKNRLFAVPVGAGIIGNPSALANVGGVTAQGLEAVASLNLTDDWSVFGSYAFNDSTYDDDTRDGNGVIVAQTEDKVTVDTPRHLLKGELFYDNGSVFGRFAVSYLSKRFFTYENDRGVSSQTVADMALGYRFSGSELFEGLEAQVNVSNLFDKTYVSTINSNGFVLRGDSQTLLAASPRKVFVTIRKAF